MGIQTRIEGEILSGEQDENCRVSEATNAPPQFYPPVCICTFNKSESDVSVNEAVDVDLLEKPHATLSGREGRIWQGAFGIIAILVVDYVLVCGVGKNRLVVGRQSNYVIFHSISKLFFFL